MHNAISYACIYVDLVVKNIERVPPLIIRDIYIYLAGNILKSTQQPCHLLNRHPIKSLRYRTRYIPLVIL